MTNTTKSFFSGSLRTYLEKFSDERKLLGYKDTGMISCLRRFDRVSLKYECNDHLPKGLVLAWIKHEPYWQSGSTQKHRITIIRKFAEFMIRQGREAYIVPKSYWPKQRTPHVPYVFSHDEIRRLIQAADNRFREQRPSIALLYRLLYCCGLRISEALNLRICDVDSDNGVLAILDGKNSRDRYVPMGADLTRECRQYKQSAFDGADPTGFFFPSPRGGAYSVTYIYHQFRWLLQD
jgi:site-specific recombinase XerD